MANRWAILALLFAVRTCMGFQFQSVPAVAPLYLDTFAISVADIGLLIGLYHAPGFALAIPGGGLGRRYGDARVVTLALVIMLGGTLSSTAPATAACCGSTRLWRSPLPHRCWRWWHSIGRLPRSTRRHRRRAAGRAATPCAPSSSPASYGASSTPASA